MADAREGVGHCSYWSFPSPSRKVLMEPDSTAPVDPQKLADKAAEKNPDTTTRREAYELDLMEEGDAEVEAGRDVAVGEAGPDEAP